MSEFTEEELEAAGLDETELAALNEEEDNPEVEPEPEVEPKPKEEPEPKEPEAEPETNVEPEPELEPEKTNDGPWYVSNREGFNKPVIDQVGAEVVSLDEKIKAAHEEYEEGGLSVAEHSDKVAGLYEKRSEIKQKLSRECDLNESYCDALDSFFVRPENAVFEDSNMFSLLDSQVRRIATEHPRMSDTAVLEAGRKVLVDMEVKGLRDESVAVPTKKPKSTIPEHTKKTLGGVPAAAPENTGKNSRFQHLQSLEGDALEVKLAELSDKDMMAYLEE